jgi:heme/copper-type cytochrome/quinol oxidase subunit 2
MELTAVKNTLRFPLFALIFTWFSFMVAIYIGIRNPQVRYTDQGQAIYPDPYVQMQTYVFLLGITVFALLALWSLRKAVSMRVAQESLLARASHRFNNLAVILSLLAGAIFAIGNFLGAWQSYEPIDEPVVIRLLNVYVPIILATALVVFVLLFAFVFRKDAPDIPEGEKDEDRAKLQRAVGMAYAAPIIGTAIAIIFGLTVYDITKTDLDTWIWVVIQVIIASSIIIGTRFAASARKARPLPPRERRAGVAAVSLNFVLSIIFGAVVLIMSFTLGAQAVDSLLYWPEWREGMSQADMISKVSDITLNWFISDFLPALVLLLLAIFGIYRTIVIRNTETEAS